MVSVRESTSRSDMPEKNDGHQERRHLVVRNLAARISVDQETDFIGAKFLPVPFAVDKVDSTHYWNSAYHLKTLKVKQLRAGSSHFDHRITVFAAEDLGEKLFDFSVQDAVGGQDVGRPDMRRFAGHIGRSSAGLFQDDDSRGHVPGIQSELPEGVDAAASDVSRGRLPPLRPAARHGSASQADNKNARLRSVPAAAGKSGRDQGILERCGAAKRESAHRSGMRPEPRSAENISSRVGS